MNRFRVRLRGSQMVVVDFQWGAELIALSWARVQAQGNLVELDLTVGNLRSVGRNTVENNRMRNIDIRKLKEVINLLLDHVVDKGFDSIALEEQFYWKVSDSEKYRVNNEPTELSVGDLFDDLDFVERVLHNKDNIVSYTLTEVASVLAYVGEVASNRLAPQGG